VRKIDTANVRIPGTSLRGWRAIGAAALGLYILLFIILNNRQLKINFVFFHVRSNALLALIVMLLLGFLAGLIVGSRRVSARPREPEPRGLQSSAAAPAPAPAPADQGAAVAGGEDATSETRS